jgi:hypothetical protein
MKPSLLFVSLGVAVCLFAVSISAQETPAPVAATLPAASAPAPAPADSTADGAVFSDIDIFADYTLGPIYILWQNLDIDAGIKKQMTSRNLAQDVFLMQNIDREQFEEGRSIHLFAQEKQKFFALFPEEAECEASGEC